MHAYITMDLLNWHILHLHIAHKCLVNTKSENAAWLNTIPAEHILFIMYCYVNWDLTDLHNATAVKTKHLRFTGMKTVSVIAYRCIMSRLVWTSLDQHEFACWYS